MYHERTKFIKLSNLSNTPSLGYHGTETRLEFNGNCLKQDCVTFNQRKEVNICIVYEISKSINISDYPTLENCLLGWQLGWLKTLISISTGFLDMELDLIDLDVFHFPALN